LISSGLNCTLAGAIQFRLNDEKRTPKAIPACCQPGCGTVKQLWIHSADPQSYFFFTFVTETNEALGEGKAKLLYVISGFGPVF